MSTSFPLESCSRFAWFKPLPSLPAFSLLKLGISTLISSLQQLKFIVWRAPLSIRISFGEAEEFGVFNFTDLQILNFRFWRSKDRESFIKKRRWKILKCYFDLIFDTAKFLLCYNPHRSHTGRYYRVDWQSTRPVVLANWIFCYVPLFVRFVGFPGISSQKRWN